MVPTQIPGLSREQYFNRIESSIWYINQHLAERLDLEAVAQAAGFSPFHFHRIFSALMGENPQDFINRLRLERAANLLAKTPSLSITEVTFLTGFSSASAFARSFKKHYGITASDYSRRVFSGQQPFAWVTANPAQPSAPAFSLPAITIRQSAGLHLAYFAGRKGYEPSSVKNAWGKMFQWAEARKLPVTPPNLVAISYDDPEITPPAKCRYYACLQVPDHIRRDPKACFLDFPEHACAVCRLECEADQIQPAYRALYCGWLPDSGYMLTGLPPYEVYYNAPDIDPGSPYVFDLCIPIEKL
jgi:AraC family transcriptional regulator